MSGGERVLTDDVRTETTDIQMLNVVVFLDIRLQVVDTGQACHVKRILDITCQLRDAIVFDSI